MRVQLLYQAGGKPASRRVVEGDWLRVGRNASCEIHLPDPRIALEQGLIVDRGGPVYVEGEAGSQDVTRKTVHATRLERDRALAIGPYRLTSVAPPAGCDAAFTIDLVDAPTLPPDLASRTGKRTLASLGLGRRFTAWGLAVLVAIVALALPIGRVLDLPWRDAAATLPAGDRFWNPGEFLLAHQPLGEKCAACHVAAFERVTNAACLACHERIGAHAAPALLPAASFGEMRCTSCHSEHKGARATHRDDARACVGCHAAIATIAPRAASRDVADFARAHPPFRLSIDGRRLRQGEAPIEERSNLVFDHAVHLDPAGVKSPDKGRVTLGCGDCHRPDASRRTFEPIVMARDCQACHRLAFEPAVTDRQVPHGAPAEAKTVVEEFYAHLALQGTPDSFRKAFGVAGQGLLRRAGDPGDAERRDALALAGRKAGRVARELFEVRVCVTCHAVERERDGWKIAPVRVNHGWMPRARFDHKTHAQAQCADCHDVAGSKRSADVAMPAIETCRECHAGNERAAGKVASGCLLCHGFHDAAHPWGASPKPGARVAGGTGAR